MLVFLVLRVQRHFHALARQFAARQRSQADDDLAHRFHTALVELGTVVLLAWSPGLGHARQVVDQQLGHHLQVEAAAVGVGALAVHIVFKGAVARAGFGQVLAPEQKLDRMPAGGDVFFATALVLLGQVGLADLELGIVDKAGVGLAFDIVHIGLVHGPGIDLAFGAVLVINRAAVEAEGFRLTVELTGIEPAFARGFQALFGGRRQEGGNGGLHVARRGQAVAVVGIDQLAVTLGHRACIQLAGLGCSGLCQCGAGHTGHCAQTQAQGHTQHRTAY